MQGKSDRWRGIARLALAALLLGGIAGCGTPEEIAARTQSSLINGGGAGNIGTRDGRHMPSH